MYSAWCVVCGVVSAAWSRRQARDVRDPRATYTGLYRFVPQAYRAHTTEDEILQDNLNLMYQAQERDESQYRY